MTHCSPFCPFLACPTCAYQGGASERGTRHVSAGETACLPLDLGGGEGKMNLSTNDPPGAFLAVGSTRGSDRDRSSAMHDPTPTHRRATPSRGDR